MRWQYKLEGEESDLYSVAEMQDLYIEEVIRKDTMVRKEDGHNWVPLGTIPDLIPEGRQKASISLKPFMERAKGEAELKEAMDYASNYVDPSLLDTSDRKNLEKKKGWDSKKRPSATIAPIVIPRTAAEAAELARQREAKEEGYFEPESLSRQSGSSRSYLRAGIWFILAVGIAGGWLFATVKFEVPRDWISLGVGLAVGFAFRAAASNTSE